MPCCSGFYNDDEGLGLKLWNCNGVMELDDDVIYICDTCFGVCGKWAHIRICGWGTGRPVGILTGEMSLA
jgi:hypothetical protein